MTETGLALLFHSHLSPRFWVDVFSIAAKLYITRHAQFDETHLPTISSSQVQPLPSLHISNFLEPHPYHIDSSPPTTSSSYIPRSSSSPCDICSDFVDESMQVDTSRAGSALPPSTSDPISIKPTVDSSSLGSHPMITESKLVYLRLVIQLILVFWGSSGLLYALLASTEPKGFKSAAKNPAWVAVMDEEIRALQQNDTWTLVLLGFMS